VAEDRRPPVWVGHIALNTPDVPGTLDFMKKLGMRPIADGDGFAVLELRGGTHLVLLAAEGRQSGTAGFDLMVDDLEATHAQLSELGLEPSPIERGRIHDSFHVASPSGHAIKFNSSHVSSEPV
jgi:catechol 2,3-dioxygenase-like lactoylglutathione lyase family enzyme